MERCGQQLDNVQRCFQAYLERTKRQVIAPADVLELLEEMGVRVPAGEAAQRAVAQLGDAGWAEVEQWWQDPTERAFREREGAAPVADGAAVLKSPRAAEEQEEQQQQEVDEFPEEEVGERVSFGERLVKSLGETLSAPVAGQLQRDEIERAQQQGDEDLHSELTLLQEADEERGGRAVAVGLAPDASYEDIAAATIPAGAVAQGPAVSDSLQSESPE